MLDAIRRFKRTILRSIKLKYLKLRYKSFRLSKNLTIDPGTKIHIGKNKLYLGNNVLLRSDPVRYHGGMPFPTTILIDVKNAQCTIGDNCRINGTYIHAKKSISLGANTITAAGVNIIDSNGHQLLSPNRARILDEPEAIIIGENVWIGLNAIILKGSQIGDNSVVAAGSVVKGIFPKNSLIQGNPAKLVKILGI